MAMFSIYQYASTLCRLTRLRKWRILVIASLLVFSMYLIHTNSRNKLNISTKHMDDVDKVISEKPVHFIFKKLEKDLEKNHEESSNGSSVELVPPKCRLPVLDPYHSSVKDLIVELGKLDCGTTHSKFENNTLSVDVQDAVSVSYRIINRPKGDDFQCTLSAPIAVTNTPKDSNSGANISQTIFHGKTGCLMHTESNKCLHPFGGKAKPDEGTRLVFYSSDCLNRIKFKVKPDGSIQHIASGLCIHVDDTTVSLQSSCSTKFKVNSTGVLQVIGSGLCIQPKNINTTPENDENVASGKTCTQVFNIIQANGQGFHGHAHVETDFLRVDIKRSGGKPDITEVHMHAAPKPEVLKRKVKNSGIPVNIALIMFDSTSSANFIRKMPKTKEYLKTRPTVYMKGNTIVGDGTTAQLCAMLTGIAEEEQPEARRSKANAKVVDDWRFVFRDYQQHGYVTMYSEDAPGVSTFTYRLKGFGNPPTDHYGRYFWMEAQRHRKSEHCAGNDAMHRLTFKYFLSLFRNYQDRLKFSFLNFSDLTHDNINSIKFADDDLTELLQTMEHEGHLDDTIVFIFGDHGLRFGKMRKTLQGKLEERLPHMSITFPTWFPKKYPKLYETVQQNSNLLTTPFDIYATLQHVLSYPLPPKGINTGQSLFVPINPKNRTCANNGVEDHWCPCMNFESVPVDTRLVKRLVNFAVSFINKLIKQESQAESLCHKLSLKEIKTALREMPNENVQKFKHSYKDNRCDSCGAVLGDKEDENTLVHDTLYQIQFVTSPNDGFFEASVKLHRGEASIKGSISRVDAYGHQPDCIKDTYVHLRKYCYCKNNS